MELLNLIGLQLLIQIFRLCDFVKRKGDHYQWVYDTFTDLEQTLLSICENAFEAGCLDSRYSRLFKSIMANINKTQDFAQCASQYDEDIKDLDRVMASTGRYKWF